MSSAIEYIAKNLHIQNGQLIDPNENTLQAVDLLIQNGRIRDIAPHGTIQMPADFETLDAQGLLITPHFIDIGASIPEPGFKNKGSIASECTAAFNAGYGHVSMLPNTNPVIDSPAVVSLIKNLAEASQTKIKLLPMGALTLGLKGTELSEVFALKAAGCIGITQARNRIKDDRILMRCLDYLVTADIPVFFFPQESQLADGGCAHEGYIADQLGLPSIPACAETIALARDLLLVERAGVKAHFCQISTAQSIELLQAARLKGLNVTADVSIAHLRYNETAIASFESIYHLSPPLRSELDRKALLAGIESGVIQAISSGHTPHDSASKNAPFPETDPGMASFDVHIPFAMELIAAKELSMLHWIKSLTKGPAEILGIDLKGFQIGDVAGINLISQSAWIANTQNCFSYADNIPRFNERLFGRVQHRIKGWQANLA